MVHTPEGSVLCVCTKFEADSSVPSKVIRGPKIWKLGHVIQATPTVGPLHEPSQMVNLLVNHLVKYRRVGRDPNPRLKLT